MIAFGSGRFRGFYFLFGKKAQIKQKWEKYTNKLVEILEGVLYYAIDRIASFKTEPFEGNHFSWEPHLWIKHLFSKVMDN